MNDVTRALLYAVCVSYYARLTERTKLIVDILPHFKAPYDIPGESMEEQISSFEAEIERYI